MTVLLLHGGVVIELSAQGQFVTLEGRKFMLNDQEFYPRVMNYEVDLVSNVDSSADPHEIYFSVAAKYDANLFGYYECNNGPNCTAQLATHFAKMVTMGFNTIRLGCPIILHQDSATEQKFYQLKVRYNNGQWPPEYRVNLDLPTFTSPMAERCFEILRSVVHLADSMGLKTILLCAEDDAGIDKPWWQLTLAEDTEAVTLYEAYVGRLAEELKDEEGLLAYDLWNEPNWTADHLTALSKAQVCEYTTRWYDAIQDADPNHFVTLGGSAYNEIGSWDPAVMKLDFYSPHIYPNPERYNYYDNANANERYKAELYWLAADCPMPWLIGETGFIAEDDTLDPMDVYYGYTYQHLDDDPVHHTMPWMGGSEQQQADFAQLSLDAVRAYGGSGYSWWDFQNTRVSWLLVQNDHPADPSRWLQGSFFGLLKYGNHIPLNDPNYTVWQTTHPWRDKLAVQTFATYDPGAAPTVLPPPPTNYYSWHGTGGPVDRQYTLVDENTQEPIANALGTVVWFYHEEGNVNDPTAGVELWDRNPTDQNGIAVIRKPPATWPDFDPPVAHDLHLELSGGEGLDYNFPNALPASGTSFELNRQRMFFSDHRQNITVPISDYRDLKTWSALKVSDMVVEGDGTTGGSADLHARDEISVGSEFHAQLGSDVHIFTEPTFMDCSSDFHAPQHGGTGQGQVHRTPLLPAALELRFQLDQPSLRLSPNPSREETTVTCSWGNWTCRVVDGNGRELFISHVIGSTQRIPTTAFSVGEYTVVAHHGGETLTCKLIKQP